jgi:hypothetical protein
MVSEDVIDDDDDKFDKPMLGIMHRQYYTNIAKKFNSCSTHVQEAYKSLSVVRCACMVRYGTSYVMLDAPHGKVFFAFWQ